MEHRDAVILHKVLSELRVAKDMIAGCGQLVSPVCGNQ